MDRGRIEYLITALQLPNLGDLTDFELKTADRGDIVGH